MAKPNKTDSAADVVPEPDDDVEPVVREASADPGSSPGEEVAPATPPKPFKDEARDAIARRYRELRDADAPKIEAAEAEPPETDTEVEPPETAEAAPDAPEAAGTKDRKEAAKPVSKKHTLIIDGKPIEMELDEIIRTAQKNVAADNRLEEAKRLLQEAKAERSRASEHPPTNGKTPSGQPDQSRAQAEPENQPDEAEAAERRKHLAERIQVGDADEGAEVLKELHQDIRKEVLAEIKRDRALTTQPEEVDRRVEARFAEREIKAALADFSKDFKDVLDDPKLKLVAITQVADEMRKDLRSIGLSDEHLAPVGDNVQALASLHWQARNNGHKVRTYAQVLTDTGTEVRTWRGGGTPINGKQPLSPKQPTPPAKDDSAKVQARIAQKRAAPQQPRPAGVRGTVQPTTPRPKTTAEIVAEQRRARGFPVTH